MRSRRLALSLVVSISTLAASAAGADAPSGTSAVDVNGIRMTYRDIGSGEVLLLLHSGTQTSQMWDDFVPRLAGHYRLIIPDLRGHGGSTNPAGVWTTQQFAADVFALLDAIGVQRVRAVGASIGGMTLLRMAALHPERIEAMVVIGVGTEIPVECARILAAVGPNDLTDDDWRQLRLVHNHGDEQIRDLYSWVASLAGGEQGTSFPPPLLATIEAPTLVIHGDRDYCFPAAMAVAVADAIPNAALWVVPNGSHVPIGGDNADAFVDATLGFFSPTKTADEQPSEIETIRRVIEYAIGWAVEKDFDRMFSIWAHDDRLYHHWLTSKSTTHGFAEFQAHAETWRDPRFRGTTSEFRDLEITLSQSGDVAWYSCRLDDCYEFDGTPGCVRNVLQTGVLEKRDGRWVHVLMHGSYPIDEIPADVLERSTRRPARGAGDDTVAGSEPSPGR